jgi:mannosyltransferase
MVEMTLQMRAGAGFSAARRLVTSPSTLVAIGLLGLAFGLRASFLGDRQLFRDEAASWLLARYPLPQMIAHTAAEPYPPLYPLVLKGWTWFAGDSEVALRSLSTVFGMATVLVGWRWASESIGRRAGLIALVVLAISPLAIANARDVRMYAMESAWTTTAWWLTWRLASGRSLGGRRRIDALALALTVCAELWTFSLGLPIAALQFAVATLPWIHRRRIEYLIAPGAIVAGGATFLPWLPTTLAAANGPPFWTPTPQMDDLGHTFAVMVAEGRLTPWTLGAATVLILAVVGVGLLSIGSVGFSARRAGVRGAMPPLLGAAVIAGLAVVPIVWLYSQVHPIYDSRYFAASVAPLAVATAIGYNWVSNRIASSLFKDAAFLGVTVLLLGSTVTWIGDWRSGVGVAPARELLASLEQRMQPGDVAVSLDARSYFQIAYLLGRDETLSRLPGPLYVWDSGREPFYFGQSLLPSRTLVPADHIKGMDWESRLPGLAPDGSIWLVALANGANQQLGFGPLDVGEVHEVGQVVLARNGETGQLRELVVIAEAR